MPPPNVTGSLHMGHAMFVTLEVREVVYIALNKVEFACSLLTFHYYLQFLYELLSCLNVIALVALMLIKHMLPRFFPLEKNCL